METFRYLEGVTTLCLNDSDCVGCGMCTCVCPHGVFELSGRTAEIVDRDGCMECGACAANCPTAAITVTPGVGCAAYIIQSWLKGAEKRPGGSEGCC